MLLLVFSVGIVIGVAATRMYQWLSWGRGSFSITPVNEEEGTYKVGIALKRGMDLTRKRYIILFRKDARK